MRAAQKNIRAALLSQGGGTYGGGGLRSHGGIQRLVVLRDLPLKLVEFVDHNADLGQVRGLQLLDPLTQGPHLRKPRDESVHNFKIDHAATFDRRIPWKGMSSMQSPTPGVRFALKLQHTSRSDHDFMTLGLDVP